MAVSKKKTIKEKVVSKKTVIKKTAKKQTVKKPTKSLKDEEDVVIKKTTKKTIKKAIKKKVVKKAKNEESLAKKETVKKVIKKTTKKTIKKNSRISLKEEKQLSNIIPETLNIENLALEHDELKLTRFETGAHSKHTGYSFDNIGSEEIPFEYGHNKCVILPVDPVLAFVYWEVTQNTLLEFLNKLGHENKLILKVYDVTNVDFNGSNANESWEIEIFERIGTWYIRHGKGDRNLFIDLGIKCSDGSFHRITRSKIIYFPRNHIVQSEKIKWMLVDEFGHNIITDEEDYTENDYKLLEQIVGKDKLKKIIKGEANFYGGGSWWGRIPELTNIIDLSNLPSSKFGSK